MKTRLALQMIKQGLVDVGEVQITRATASSRSGERYLIYLPMNRNYLWRLLHDMHVKIRVYLEIPEDVLEKVDKEGT
jgi:hypothetical protein